MLLVLTLPARHQVYHVSMTHCRALVVHNFIAAVDALRIERPGLYPVLKRLSDLFALHGFEKVGPSGRRCCRHALPGSLTAAGG